jgi:hypothetical protein
MRKESNIMSLGIIIGGFTELIIDKIVNQHFVFIFVIGYGYYYIMNKLFAK